jgi:phosphatidylglycerol lysyltransferase
MNRATPPPSPTRSSASQRWLRHLGWVISLGLLGVMTWLLHRYLSVIAWSDVTRAWSQLPAPRILASLAASAISLGMLALFDVIAARAVVGRRVAMRLSAFAGAVTQAVSNTLGFHAITGGAVRYRIYIAAGVEAGDIARIVALAGLGVAMGFAISVTAALCWQPDIVHGWGRGPGIVMAIGLIGLLVWLARRPRRLRVWQWNLVFPGAGTAALQMLVGALEMAGAIGALYVLLPAQIAPPFIDFLPIYVGAVVTGIISHTPGGIGVFEAIMLAAFPAPARADLLAAMMCYRLTYNLLPFMLGMLALGAFELYVRRGMRLPQFGGR